MSDSILIVGQGIAGTALGLALEEAGVDFSIIADSHVDAASRVAAGLINPVTGQRFVKNWRVDELLPLAREAYARWGRLLGVEAWHPVQIERRFRNELERERARRKAEVGELQPYLTAIDDDKVVISGGAWVDLSLLMTKARERWLAAGRLIERRSDDALRLAESGRRIVLCVGASDLVAKFFPAIRAMPVKGEIIAVEGEAFDPTRVWHDGNWIRAETPTRARVGATYDPGRSDRECTTGARETLLKAAEKLMARAQEARGQGAFFKLCGHDAGVRLATMDRLPVAGWSSVAPEIGILGALGSKGALWAPWMATMWAAHLARGSSLDSVVSPQRFVRASDASH